MAAFDLEEQEQISTIKAWWEANGTKVTVLAVVLAVGVLGWTGWQAYRRSQAEEANVILAAAQKAAAANNPKNVASAANDLIARFPGTAQAAMGALLAAKLNADSGDMAAAKTQLGWVAEHADSPEFRDIARLRLAGLLLDEKAYDEALKQLEREPAPSFAARFGDLRGDVLVAQNKPAEARKAYEAALAKVDEAAKASGTPNELAESRLKPILQLKLETVGGVAK